MNRSTLPASGLATVISGTLQSATSSRPALYERSGPMTISQAIDVYMAAYEGRDESRAQRMAWWQAKIGYLSLSEVDEDHIFMRLKTYRAKSLVIMQAKMLMAIQFIKPKINPIQPQHSTDMWQPWWPHFVH